MWKVKMAFVFGKLSKNLAFLEQNITTELNGSLASMKTEILKAKG
jgi:hypothetical protein